MSDKIGLSLSGITQSGLAVKSQSTKYFRSFSCKNIVKISLVFQFKVEKKTVFLAIAMHLVVPQVDNVFYSHHLFE